MSQSEHRRAWDRARHARDKDKRNAARRAAHALNPQRLREVEKERYRHNPLAKARIGILSKYGDVALEAWDQETACASCGDPVSGKNKHVDHDHSIPKKGFGSFRGILCGRCNCALGYLKEDPRRIMALFNYIKSRRRKPT